MKTLTNLQFAVFVMLLIMPTIYQRTKFNIKRSSFDRTPLREKSGLNIHHGHWGFLLAMISAFMLVFGWRNAASIGLVGLGFGLMLDEIVPMLKMPSPGRDLELEAYGKSRNATILLVGVVATLSLILFLIF